MSPSPLLAQPRVSRLPPGGGPTCTQGTRRGAGGLAQGVGGVRGSGRTLKIVDDVLFERGDTVTTGSAQLGLLHVGGTGASTHPVLSPAHRRALSRPLKCRFTVFGPPASPRWASEPAGQGQVCPCSVALTLCLSQSSCRRAAVLTGLLAPCPRLPGLPPRSPGGLWPAPAVFCVGHHPAQRPQERREPRGGEKGEPEGTASSQESLAAPQTLHALRGRA